MMKEEKFKRIVIGSTVTAVILLVFLLCFMVYQLISIGQKKSLEADLLAQIEYCQHVIATSENDIEIYNSRVWLEMAARKLGMLGYGDIDLNSITDDSLVLQDETAEITLRDSGEIVYEIRGH